MCILYGAIASINRLKNDADGWLSKLFLCIAFGSFYLLYRRGIGGTRVDRFGSSHRSKHSSAVHSVRRELADMQPLP